MLLNKTRFVFSATLVSILSASASGQAVLNELDGDYTYTSQDVVIKNHPSHGYVAVKSDSEVNVTNGTITIEAGTLFKFDEDMDGADGQNGVFLGAHATSGEAGKNGYSVRFQTLFGGGSSSLNIIIEPSVSFILSAGHGGSGGEGRNAGREADPPHQCGTAGDGGAGGAGGNGGDVEFVAAGDFICEGTLLITSEGGSGGSGGPGGSNGEPPIATRAPGSVTCGSAGNGGDGGSGGNVTVVATGDVLIEGEFGFALSGGVAGSGGDAGGMCSTMFPGGDGGAGGDGGDVTIEGNHVWSGIAERAEIGVIFHGGHGGSGGEGAHGGGPCTQVCGGSQSAPVMSGDGSPGGTGGSGGAGGTLSIAASGNIGGEIDEVFYAVILDVSGIGGRGGDALRSGDYSADESCGGSCESNQYAAADGAHGGRGGDGGQVTVTANGFIDVSGASGKHTSINLSAWGDGSFESGGNGGVGGDGFTSGSPCCWEIYGGVGGDGGRGGDAGSITFNPGDFIDYNCASFWLNGGRGGDGGRTGSGGATCEPKPGGDGGLGGAASFVLIIVGSGGIVQWDCGGTTCAIAGCIGSHCALGHANNDCVTAVPGPAGDDGGGGEQIPCEPCPESLCWADCDGSGALDVFDFLCFQSAFIAGNRYADCDGNGWLDIWDMLCFQASFLAGCS
jgi:hypothetical protein